MNAGKKLLAILFTVILAVTGIYDGSFAFAENPAGAEPSASSEQTVSTTQATVQQEKPAPDESDSAAGDQKSEADAGDQDSEADAGDQDSEADAGDQKSEAESDDQKDGSATDAEENETDSDIEEEQGDQDSDESSDAKAEALQFFTDTDEDIAVIAAAPGGAFPDGVTMTVKKVDDEDTIQVIRDTLDREEADITAVDITFKDQSGNDIQPDKPVQITIKSDTLTKSENPVIIHVPDEGEPEKLSRKDNKIESDTEKKEVSFKADSFSVYAVVDDGTVADEARMELNFYNGDTKLATVYIKNSDDTDAVLEQIIYDPGVGTMNPGELFKGWILDKEDYDVSDASDSMDIADIRAWAKNLTNGNAIGEGDIYNFYALIYKTFAVVYKDEDGTTIHSEALIFKPSEGSVDYTVDEPYTPKEQDEAFQGWYWTNSDPNVTDPIVAKDGSSAPFVNGTEVTLKDNITFTVYVPRGYWLSFVENGDGASYTPPQFIQTETTTQEPPDPTRIGYQFGGWYTNPECTGDEFTFGQSIDQRTILYAKWIPIQTADYRIVIWKQNLAGGDNYDFAETISLSGTVGSTINTVSAVGNGYDRYARVNGTDKKYTGFHLDHFDQNVTIAPEGTSVVNVYYDRNEYSVRFYFARTPNNNNSRAWSVATGTTQNQELNPFNQTTWTNTNQNRTEYGPSADYVVNGNNRYYYYTITALYGQDISDQWPSYDWFPDLGNYQLISWWMMHSAGAYGGAGNGRDTVKGVISMMDEQLLGDLSNRDGNILIARYSNNQPNIYNYKIWKELPDGFDVPSGKQTTTRNGVRYYLDETLLAKGNSGPSGIHQPEYMGFENDGFTYRAIRDLGGGRSEYDVEMYYSRDKFRIIYMDGLYYNGNGVIKKDETGVEMRETGDIYYESDIHSYNKGGSNYYEPSDDEYVFAGWYRDKACQDEAVFDELPDHNVTVYAKWQEKQYRVFLHPNVPTEDISFSMGGQSTSFRMDWGEKIAGGNQIHAVRDDYDLIGWYTDEACTKPFNFDAYVLNDTTVTTPYDKTEPTERDQYGNPTGPENRDAINDRFWINTKLDLYAKWRARLDGAAGIDVVYDAGEGTNPPTDPLIYLDNSEATAGAASTPDSDEKQFLHWVVQTWNGTDYEDTDVIVYPGDIYIVLKDNAKPVVTEWVNPDDEDDVLTVTDPEPGMTPPDATHTKIKTATYTVQLRAEYGDKDAPTPTHIWWFANDVDIGTRHEAMEADDSLQINQAVDIPTPDARPGYKFLGWARIDENVSESAPASGSGNPTGKGLALTEDDLFLKYDEGDESYTAEVNGSWVGVSKIAADENDPYHDMYAVWEPATYTVTIRKHIDGDYSDVTKEFTYTPSTTLDANQSTFSLTNYDTNTGNQKVYNDVNYGTVINITESSQDYKISTVQVTKFSDAGLTRQVSTAQIQNGEDITVDNYVLIEYTNELDVILTGIRDGNPLYVLPLLTLAGLLLLFGFVFARNRRRKQLAGDR